MREIVVDPHTGKWYTVGDRGAEFVNIPEGAIVFNHKQTESLLENGYVAGRAHALVSGTAMVSGGRKSNTDKKTADNTSNFTVPTVSQVKQAADATRKLEEDLEETLKNMKESMDDIVGDYEHQIFLMEKSGKNSSAIIETYKQMQKAVHDQAEEYRKKGLKDNSEVIEELQKKWWEYKESIQELIVENFENAVGELENKIKLTENWFDNAVASSDYGNVKKYTSDIVDYYKQMQKTIHEEAEYYRALGYSDTSEELADLSDKWWEYEENIKDAITKAYEEVVGGLENSVTLTENWLDNAVVSRDYSSIARYTSNIVYYYRQMQKAIHEQAEQYRDLGYSDTSDAVSELSDKW